MTGKHAKPTQPTQPTPQPTPQSTQPTQHDSAINGIASTLQMRPNGVVVNPHEELRGGNWRLQLIV
eukprot:7128993-Alexandrium_andersonii.AAC.1